MSSHIKKTVITLAVTLAVVGGTLAALRQTRRSANLATESAPLPLRGDPITPAAASPPASNPNTVSSPVQAEALPSTPSAAPASLTPEAQPVHVALAASKVEGNPPSAATNEMIGEYVLAGFDKLASFTYEMPDETAGPSNASVPAVQPASDQIPTRVRAFNDKKVALRGFMLPLKVEGGLVTEMLIMRDQSMCCYGTVPKINEWVSVKMSGKGVKPVMDQPITMFGLLHVGEMRENGYLVGIYSLDGEKMSSPLDL